MNIIIEKPNFFYILFYRLKYFFVKNEIFFLEKKKNYSIKILDIIFRKKTKKLQWKFVKIKNKDGTNLWWHIYHFEFESFLNDIINSKLSETNINNDKYLKLFFLKQISSNSHNTQKFENLYPFTNMSLMNIIFLINVIKILFEKDKKNNLLVLPNMPWKENIIDYANKQNIDLEFVNNNILSIFFNIIIYDKLHKFLRFLKSLILSKKPDIAQMNRINNDNDNIVINNAIDINHPENFMNSSILDSKKCIFINRGFNIENASIKRLFKNDYIFIDFSYFKMFNFQKPKYLYGKTTFYEKIYLKKIYNDFFYEKNIWLKIFQILKCKIYLTSHFVHKQSIAACSALNQLNGLSICYTNSYYEFTSPNLRFNFDIFLSYSNKTLTNIFQNNSYSKLILSIGYLNSYKFDKIKPISLNIRSKLLNKNVKKIISFFDQGEVDEDQYNTGYANSINGYKYLFLKLLENEWMGLILKPKKPGLLNKKLSIINDLLNESLKTGRLIIYNTGSGKHTKNFENPVCEAAMASDISIHDTMLSATAGIEAYLSGCRTIFLDYFGFKKSRFYKNQKKIVFENWDDLWISLIKYFDNKDKNFGIWDQEIVNEIDFFTDNKSDERVSYILSKVKAYYQKNQNIDSTINSLKEDYEYKYLKK